MDHFKYIYANRAADYHHMIEAEDVDNNLIKTIQKITTTRNKRILDLGSGSGRIPILLTDEKSDIIALDLNFPMLIEQQFQQNRGRGNWPLIQGDMRFLPFLDNSQDIVIAGWAIAHLRSWYEIDWKKQISLIIEGMLRLTKPSGHIIIMETMTTGSLTPAPPTTELAELYDWFTSHWGLSQNIISTDYLFHNLEDAIKSTEFFFGPDMAELIKNNNWVRLPEWTGIWSKTKTEVNKL
jgi:ubiquinone/menaquinone biosynthesis C-methylase UbiE